MPSSTLATKFNYAKLHGRIKEIYGTQKAFAQALGISAAALSAKLNNKKEFEQSEITAALKLLGLTSKDITAYFFAPAVQ